MDVFETERLVAREWDPEHHLEGAFAIYSDPEVVRYIGTGPAQTLEEMRARLEAVALRNAGLRQGLGSWPLFDKGSGELVGAVLLKPPPASGTNGTLSTDIEIGWHLARRHWGKGFATEAGRALVERGFTQLSLPELHAVVESPNQRSRAVALRLGMKHLGRTDRYYDLELEHFVLRAE
ncbi:MAG: GNAT family N-acetyltransferase [Myxococcales bacterium]|nr:GNAT family N-acetyltransferase [Myxococcales bacterium]